MAATMIPEREMIPGEGVGVAPGIILANGGGKCSLPADAKSRRAGEAHDQDRIGVAKKATKFEENKKKPRRIQKIVSLRGFFGCLRTRR